jgi:hypothetical protein
MAPKPTVDGTFGMWWPVFMAILDIDTPRDTDLESEQQEDARSVVSHPTGDDRSSKIPSEFEVRATPSTALQEVQS